MGKVVEVSLWKVQKRQESQPPSLELAFQAKEGPAVRYLQNNSPPLPNYAVITCHTPEEDVAQNLQETKRHILPPAT